MKSTTKFILLLIFLTGSISGLSQDKIEKSKQEIKEGIKRDERDNHRRKRSHSSSETYNSHDSFENMIIGGIVQGFLFVTCYAAIGNYEVENHLHRKMTTYPYYNSKSGNYESADAIPALVKHFRIDLQNQFLYSNERLFGNHLKFKIRPFQYFFLQADYFQLVEYSAIYKEYANLSLFNFNLCYDRIRFEKFNLGWTLGANYIGNEVKKAGFSYGLNTEIFAARNLSLFSSAKWSSINNAPVNEFELQGKYHINKYFISLGYEYLKIGAPTYDFISVGGGVYL